MMATMYPNNFQRLSSSSLLNSHSHSVTEGSKLCFLVEIFPGSFNKNLRVVVSFHNERRKEREIKREGGVGSDGTRQGRKENCFIVALLPMACSLSGNSNRNRTSLTNNSRPDGEGCHLYTSLFGLAKKRKVKVKH